MINMSAVREADILPTSQDNFPSTRCFQPSKNSRNCQVFLTVAIRWVNKEKIYMTPLIRNGTLAAEKLSEPVQSELSSPLIIIAVEDKA